MYATIPIALRKKRRSAASQKTKLSARRNDGTITQLTDDEKRKIAANKTRLEQMLPPERIYAHESTFRYLLLVPFFSVIVLCLCFCGSIDSLQYLGMNF